MVPLCLSLILVALVINLPLTAWLVSAGKRWGRMDEPAAIGADEQGIPTEGYASHKQHDQPIPVTGGIGIAITCLAPLALILLATLFLRADNLPTFLAAAGEHIAGLKSHAGMAAAVLFGALFLHIVGLIDDRRGLGPYLKLFVQFAVAAVIVVGFDVRVLQLLDDHPNLGGLGYFASVAVSVLWIVSITNAINFLDNMDGLAGGVSAIIAALYLAATLIGGQWFVAGMCALLLGSLIGFLVYNFPPAKVFMGDAGSLVVGFLLAVISIRTTYLPVPPDVVNGAASEVTASAMNGRWYAVLMPLVLLAVPLYDLTSVTLIRIAQGKSPFRGDQQHFSHRLVKKGLSKRTAVLVIWLCTLATGLGGVMLGRLEGWQAALVAGQTVAVLGVLAMLERTRSSSD